jgi:hypothetical protein
LLLGLRRLPSENDTHFMICEYFCTYGRFWLGLWNKCETMNRSC